MGAKSLYLAKEILDHVFGAATYTPPASVWLALLTVRPLMSDTGSTITEANYTSYARKEVVNNATNFPAATDLSQTPLTSGTLEIGQRYVIDDFNTGDDFTNVGASSNATGVEFVASGTTPTTWTNSSSLLRMGALKSNGVDLEFAECTGGLSSLTHIAILDASTAGNILGIATLDSSKEISLGDVPRFPAGSVKIYQS